MKYDLVIVGTGFASSFFLKKYLEKANTSVKVLVIERGEFISHPDMIKVAQNNPPAYYKKIEQDIDAVKNKSSKAWIFSLQHGGSSNCWWGCTPRFMPNDFKLKSLYNKGFDWPITYDDLETYYCEVEKIMNISGPSDTPFTKSCEYPLPPHIFSTVDRKMKEGHGPMWVNQPTARASRPVGNRGQCCGNYSCSICPMNAKFTIVNGLNEIYRDPRVEIKYGLQVFRLEFENALVKKVICTSTANKGVNKLEIFEGDIVVLGANAIFNAHILLSSGDTNPFVGKGFGEQRAFFINAYLDMDNVGGSTSITANGYMEYDGAFRSESASCLIENHNGPFIRNEKGKWRKISQFKCIMEVLPENRNRIELNSDTPFIPSIVYGEEDEYVLKGKKRIEDNVNKIFAPLTVEELHIQDFGRTEGHMLGSCRMGINENDSVVDKYQMHHKYRNLFVLGGSSFATYAAANPTLTISSLSLFSADKVF